MNAVPAAVDADSHASDSHRQQLRRLARELWRHPADGRLHARRVRAAQAARSSDIAQGVLADLFACFGGSEGGLRTDALQRLGELLPPMVAQQFAAQVTGARLGKVNRLATRWSIFCTPSAATPTRARRSNPDASNALAGAAVAAVIADDTSAQQGFLDHCISCSDTLAFQLARRELNRRAIPLPPPWHTTFEQLARGGTTER